MAQTDVWTTRSAPTGVAYRVVPASRFHLCPACGMLASNIATYCSVECFQIENPQDFNDDDTEADDAPIR